MLFQKGSLSIRYVIEDDVNTISKWLTNPEVLQYYEGRDNPQFQSKFVLILFMTQRVLRKDV